MHSDFIVFKKCFIILYWAGTVNSYVFKPMSFSLAISVVQRQSSGGFHSDWGKGNLCMGSFRGMISFFSGAFNSKVCYINLDYESWMWQALCSPVTSF